MTSEQGDMQGRGFRYVISPLNFFKKLLILTLEHSIKLVCEVILTIFFCLK